MTGRGNVRRGFVLVGDVSGRGSVRRGSIRRGSVRRGCVRRGNVRRGIVRRGCVRIPSRIVFQTITKRLRQ